MTWFYYAGRLLSRIALFFTRYRVYGRENVPPEGPLLIVANHIAVADPPIIAVSIKRGMIFMAKDTLFEKRWKAYFIRGFGAFSVHRERLDTKVLRRADKVLKEGLALVMFPEGGRSRDYRLKPAKPGSAIIATRRNVPILPVGITGAEHLQGIMWIFKRPRVEVKIGPVFRLPEVNGKIDKEKLKEYSAITMDHIAELLPPEYLGDAYADRKSQ